MARRKLNDKHWSSLRIIMLEDDTYDKSDLRKTVEGTHYIASMLDVHGEIYQKDLDDGIVYFNHLTVGR